MAEVYKLTIGNENADLIGNTNEVIQAGIDMIAGIGGGHIDILPGKYIMNDSLHLRSGVTVSGHGSKTVLWKLPSKSSAILCLNGYGMYAVSVAEPEKFEAGSGIFITDDRGGGFSDTVATIIYKRDNELGLTRALNSDVAGGALNGRIVSIYPVISGYKVKNACVRDLVIDGNANENEHLQGCRGGGIFLLQSNDVNIYGVTVRCFNGDGISFQQCRRITIDKCIFRDNSGSGIHLGSGSVGSIIRNTTCAGNKREGILYCLRVSFTLCEDCIVKDNILDGFSIGHMDSDSVIRRNTVENNGRYAIYFRKDSFSMTGHRTLISLNSFINNCKFEGIGEIYLDSVAEDVHITDNCFKSKDMAGRSKAAIFVAANTERLIICNNKESNIKLIDTADKAFLAQVSFDKHSLSLNTGLEQIPEEAFWHLGPMGGL